MTRLSVASSKARRKAHKIQGKAFKKTVKETTQVLKLKKGALKAREKRALKYDRPISLRKGPYLIGEEDTFAVQREAKDYESTAIYYFDYDHETRTLLVQFWMVKVKNGVVIRKWPSSKKYIFPNISPKLYDDFVKTGSKGRFFLAHIKGKEFRRLD